MAKPERSVARRHASQAAGDVSHKTTSVTASAASATPVSTTTPTRDAVIGQVVWLMMQTPIFRHLFLADLEWMVMPPILLSQFRLFRIENRVVAFAAWAHLSEVVEARLQEANPRLAPAEWKSGDRLWLIHLLAPFGHTEAALADLEKTSLAGKSFKMHRVQRDGSRVVEQRNQT